MSRKIIACAFSPVLAVALVCLTSCRTLSTSGGSAAKGDLRPTYLDYVDSDGFDALLETSLINQDPVIVIRTGHAKPNWEGRLNAWIAAWNHESRKPGPGRRASSDDPEPTVRGQAPVPKVTVDGESIREFRLLVGGLFDRIDDTAQSGATWWAEERSRSRRVALLKPYSLRFHMGDDNLIQLVFFHGGYAGYYSRHLQLLMSLSEVAEAKWSRSMECSACPQNHKRERHDSMANQEGSQ